MVFLAAPCVAGQRPEPPVRRPAAASADLSGQVVDARTGEPLEKVLVSTEDPSSRVLTGADGRFRLAGLTPGVHRVRASVVGYALFRQDVRVVADAPPLLVRLTEGTTAFTETVTVRPDTFRTPVDPIPSASILGSAELLNLRGVLADDPLRAVQVLPGVATGDDLRSEFTVRGSDFRHLTFTVDGFATPYLVHTVRGVEDRGPTGSVAMINSDILEDVTLLNGGYPQKYGGHTGAEVDFRTREGSRDRRIFRAAVSGTSASAVAEGPIGGDQRGSWLVSGRQSFLDLLVHRLTAHAITFAFADAQARVAYDLTSSQRIDITALAGHSRFENEPEQNDVNDIFDSSNASAVGIVSWRSAWPRLVLTQRVLAAENHYRNRNPSGAELGNGHDRQLAYRADASVSLRRGVGVEAGGSVERVHERRLERVIYDDRYEMSFADYSSAATRSGAYVSLRWTPVARVTLAPGVRADRWGLTDQSATSPWIQSEWKLSAATTLRASAGRYRQFPDFDQVLGATATRELDAEQADQFDVGMERRLRATLRASASIYDREERHMIWRPHLEPAIVAGHIEAGSPLAAYEGALEGHARGVELLVHRSVAGRGVSGLVSYSYGVNRYRDVTSGERFDGDFDQRHAFNAFAIYRHSDRASFVGKLRMGSNFPIPGYYAETSGAFRLTSVRNTARLPAYARLDLRANRTFSWSERRVTLFAEVINVLNRANVRFDPPFVNYRTGQTGRPFDTMLPIVPSLGLLIEF